MIKLIKLYEKLERISTIQPDEGFWEKFAESQIKKYNNFASVRDTGETIQGTCRKNSNI